MRLRYSEEGPCDSFRDLTANDSVDSSESNLGRTASLQVTSADPTITNERVLSASGIAVDGLAHRWLLLALVFLCGGSSIGTELAMSRLLAPYFGTSTFIWANLIGLTLAFLAIGYTIGGRLADRNPSIDVMLMIAGLAGFAVATIPIIAKPILRLSLDAFDDLNAGVFFGSFFASLLLMAFPMLLFGCISPFAIRMRTQNIRSSGETAGNIYALSTLGSIVGSFLASVGVDSAVWDPSHLPHNGYGTDAAINDRAGDRAWRTASRARRGAAGRVVLDSRDHLGWRDQTALSRRARRGSGV